MKTACKYKNPHVDNIKHTEEFIKSRVDNMKPTGELINLHLANMKLTGEYIYPLPTNIE